MINGGGNNNNTSKMRGGTLPRMVAGSGSVGGSGTQQPANTITSSTCNYNLLVSANYFASPVVVTRPSCSVKCCFCHGEKACTRIEKGRRGDNNNNMASGCFYNLIFGQVPCRFEVENAVSALQNFMQGISSSWSTSSWFHQMFGNYGQKILQSPGFGRVFDAFRLLQTEQTFQKIVVSLATDKAVWDAVLKNNVVRQFQESLYPAAEGERLDSYGNEQDLTSRIMRWILNITKGKVIELIESFRELVNEIFQSPGKEKPTAEVDDQLDEKVRSSVLLSIVILLIVVITRAQRV